MKIVHIVQSMIDFVSDAVSRIFAPNHDHYPATGMVPFAGEVSKHSH
ncbi:MAG: hypothetical protein KME35_11425 [Aphanocapsa sp. GSE-SYN-MK-11-07L]|jgi:hypothetical protein|nr:hypothetical protein [Aphanocapsa sp. GSE-SYN-MK-11-07L]